MMHILDSFPPFPVGAIRSPLQVRPERTGPPATAVRVQCPTRLNAMALDSSKILPSGGGYPAGELFFVCSLLRTAEVTAVEDGPAVQVAEGSTQPVVAEHAARLLVQTLDIRTPLRIHVTGPDLPSHIGLGSSSSTMTAVAIAVARAAGVSLPRRQMMRFLAENHGEEIDGDREKLMPVQCLGGSAAAGLIPGAVQVLAGRSMPLLAADLLGDYTIVLAYPNELNRWDAAESLTAEAKSFDGFARTGRKYGREIAYRLLHDAWPSLLDGNLRVLGQLLFDYRFRMGSIENCAFSHPQLISIAAAIEAVFLDGLADVLSLSSVGPLFFAVTRTPDPCAAALRAAGLNTLACATWAEGYRAETGR